MASSVGKITAAARPLLERTLVAGRLNEISLASLGLPWRLRFHAKKFCGAKPLKRMALAEPLAAGRLRFVGSPDSLELQQLGDRGTVKVLERAIKGADGRFYVNEKPVTDGKRDLNAERLFPALGKIRLVNNCYDYNYLKAAISYDGMDFRLSVNPRFRYGRAARERRIVAWADQETIAFFEFTAAGKEEPIGVLALPPLRAMGRKEFTLADLLEAFAVEDVPIPNDRDCRIMYRGELYDFKDCKQGLGPSDFLEGRMFFRLGYRDRVEMIRKREDGEDVIGSKKLVARPAEAKVMFPWAKKTMVPSRPVNPLTGQAHFGSLVIFFDQELLAALGASRLTVGATPDSFFQFRAEKVGAERVVSQSKIKGDGGLLVDGKPLIVDGKPVTMCGSHCYLTARQLFPGILQIIERENKMITVPWSGRPVLAVRRINPRTGIVAVGSLLIYFGKELRQRFDLSRLAVESTPSGIGLIDESPSLAIAGTQVIGRREIDPQARLLADGRPLKIDGKDVRLRGTSDNLYLPAEFVFYPALGPIPENGREKTETKANAALDFFADFAHSEETAKIAKAITVTAGRAKLVFDLAQDSRYLAALHEGRLTARPYDGGFDLFCRQDIGTEYLGRIPGRAGGGEILAAEFLPGLNYGEQMRAYLAEEFAARPIEKLVRVFLRAGRCAAGLRPLLLFSKDYFYKEENGLLSREMINKLLYLVVESLPLLNNDASLGAEQKNSLVLEAARFFVKLAKHPRVDVFRDLLQERLPSLVDALEANGLGPAVEDYIRKLAA